MAQALPPRFSEGFFLYLSKFQRRGELIDQINNVLWEAYYKSRLKSEVIFNEFPEFPPRGLLDFHRKFLGDYPIKNESFNAIVAEIDELDKWIAEFEILGTSTAALFEFSTRMQSFSDQMLSNAMNDMEAFIKKTPVDNISVMIAVINRNIHESRNEIKQTIWKMIGTVEDFKMIAIDCSDGNFSKMFYNPDLHYKTKVFLENNTPVGIGKTALIQLRKDRQESFHRIDQLTKAITALTRILRELNEKVPINK